MSTLEVVVLGLLGERPRHGYSLKRALSPALSRERQLNDGVLYPLLKRLEAKGLLRGEVERSAQGRERRVFHCTRAGEAAFEAWLASPEDEDDEVDYDFLVGHPFLAKAMFFDGLDAPAVRAKLHRQRDSLQAKLGAFRRIRSGMMARGVSGWRIAILELGIAQARCKARWLDKLCAEAEAA